MPDPTPIASGRSTSLSAVVADDVEVPDAFGKRTIRSGTAPVVVAEANAFGLATNLVMMIALPLHDPAMVGR